MAITTKKVKASSLATERAFSIRLVSKSSGKSICFINLTDEFTLAVFGCKAIDVTYAEAIDKDIAQFFATDKVEVVIKDAQAVITKVDPSDF